MIGLLGRKIGMTQLYDNDGALVAATVLKAGPCVVVQRKTVEKDGYESAQLGLVSSAAAKRANKPSKGHHEKAGVPPTRVLREFALVGDEAVNAGDAVSVKIFEDVAKVDVIGTSKGRGFQGVMKRHGFSGGRATHGSMFHRGPGSIGQSAWPSKVIKGMRGPGRMGHARITCKNLKVMRIDEEKNLLLVRGSVPGARGTTLLIRRSRSGKAAS